MSKVCKKCGKQVYFAEEQLYEGSVFHIGCFTIWNKERTAAELAPRNKMYEAGADVAPAYYRTSDGSAGGPRMESGSEYKTVAGGSSPRGTAPAATSGPQCSKCGFRYAGQPKFCGECGNKLVH